MEINLVLRPIWQVFKQEWVVAGFIEAAGREKQIKSRSPQMN